MKKILLFVVLTIVLLLIGCETIEQTPGVTIVSANMSLSHLGLTNIGTNSHDTVDNHIITSAGVHGVSGTVLGSLITTSVNWTQDKHQYWSDTNLVDRFDQYASGSTWRFYTKNSNNNQWYLAYAIDYGTSAGNQGTISYYGNTLAFNPASQVIMGGSLDGSAVSLVMQRKASATSGSQLKDSQQLRFRSAYWNGSSSSNMDWYLQAIQNATTPKTSLEFTSPNAGKLLELQGDNTTGKIGLYGVTPVAKAGAINTPTGGGTQDAEARAAINSIIDALKNLGVTQ